MTTFGLSNHLRALRMRPLATGLAAICAASMSFTGEAVAAVHADNSVRDLAARFGHVILAPPPPGPRVAVTNCDDSGPGSLRDTVVNAADGDTVDLTGLTCGRITLTTGAIVFGQQNLAIQGPGETDLTIDGGLNGGVLYHLGGGTVSVSDVTMGYSFKYRSDSDVLGSCVHSEGNAILTRVRLTTCNTVTTLGYSALGGAVFTSGALQLDHSIVTASEAHATGYGYASGGGVYALGGLISMYSTIANNTALDEGSRPSFGGGAFARGGSFILGTTVSGNQSLRMGGLALADNHDTPSTLVNSTVSGNHADTIGGVFARARLDIYNSTVAFNTSHTWTDGSGHYFGAGVYITTSGEMDSTILSNNVNDGAPFPTTDLTGAAGTGFNGGHNNVGLCGVPCPNDTSHEDPGLGPLSDHGGITLTHVPTPGQWDTFGGTNVLNMPWDQRGPGFPRQSSGDFPEIGALQINSDIILANGFNG